MADFKALEHRRGENGCKAGVGDGCTHEVDVSQARAALHKCGDGRVINVRATLKVEDAQLWASPECSNAGSCGVAAAIQVEGAERRTPGGHSVHRLLQLVAAVQV